MKLYFSPLACSLATRIALYEAGAAAEFVEVDPKTKQLPDGGDFRAIHGLGLVPVLRTADGDLLTENAAVLQHVADAFPDARLAPRDARAREKLHQWLCFIGTELHKGFAPLLDKLAPDAVKAYGLGRLAPKLAWLASQLDGRDTLLDSFSVADAYLFAVLNWAQVTPVQLSKYPPLAAFMTRMLARPAVARAFDEERALYVLELRRHNQPLPAISG